VIGSVPYTITPPGNYVLESDLTYVGTLRAIDVKADNVVINLNGFSINTTGRGAYCIVNENHANLTVQNGGISGFYAAMLLAGPQCRAVNLHLVNNFVGVQMTAKNCAVQNCFIIGRGKDEIGTGIQCINSASGVLVKGNQVSEFVVAITSSATKGSAFIGNYVANSEYGLLLTSNDFYQDNVVTNCRVPFEGGKAIGTENGGN
jgi:nitrous oxidase accessory protein NosD